MGSVIIKLNPAPIKPEVTRFKIGDTSVSVEKYEYGKFKAGITFINMHENELTSVKAAKAVLSHNKSGRLLRFVSKGKRLVTFKLRGRRYRIDPNRIFTDKGIKKTLRTHGKYSRAAHRAVRTFVDKFLKKYKLRKSVTIISLHNNTDRGSLTIRRLKRRVKRGDLAYINKKEDGDDFFYVTNPWFYYFLGQHGFNAYFKDLGRVKDDGSLSVFCKKNIIPYINIEAQHGHLRQQVAMLYHSWRIATLYYFGGYLLELDQGARTFLSLGIHWAKRKKYHKALAYFTRVATMRNPKGLLGAYIYMNRASVWLALKKYTKALADYNKAIKLYAKKDIIYYNRGVLYYKQKQYRKAYVDYSKAIALNPRNSLAYNNRGVTRIKLGQKAKAQADFKKSCQLNKSFCP